MDEFQAPREERRPADSVVRTDQGSSVRWSDVVVALLFVTVFWVPALLSASEVLASSLWVRAWPPSARPPSSFSVAPAKRRSDHCPHSDGCRVDIATQRGSDAGGGMVPVPARPAARGRSRIIGGAAVAVMVLAPSHGSSTPAVGQRIILSAVVIGAVWLLGQAEREAPGGGDGVR